MAQRYANKVLRRQIVATIEDSFLLLPLRIPFFFMIIPGLIQIDLWRKRLKIKQYTVWSTQYALLTSTEHVWGTYGWRIATKPLPTLTFWDSENAYLKSGKNLQSLNENTIAFHGKENILLCDPYSFSFLYPF